MLRPYRLSDVDDHTALFASPQAKRWCSVVQPYTRAHGLAWCAIDAEAARTSGDGVNWAVTDRRSGAFLAGMGLLRTDWTARVTEVSGTASRAAMGHGLATEALRAICDWVLVDQAFHRVRIHAAPDNRPCRVLAASCGFTNTGPSPTHPNLIAYELINPQLAAVLLPANAHSAG